MILIGPAGFMAAPGNGPKQEKAPDPEMEWALTAARGAWAIIRKGRRDKPPTVRRFKRRRETVPAPMAASLDGTNARFAWSRLDVRQGWAMLVDPDGKVIEQQVAPYLRTRW